MVGLKLVSLKSFLVGRGEDWVMKTRPSKGGLGFEGPVKASTLPAVDFEAMAQEKTLIEANGGRKSISNIFEEDPMIAVAPLLSQIELSPLEVLGQSL